MKDNKVRATKAVSSKDAGHDDPEDGNSKGALPSSKDAMALQEYHHKSKPGKVKHRVPVIKATVKGEVTDSGKLMKGAACTNTGNHVNANVCVIITTMMTTSVQQRQRCKSNVGFG